MRLCQAWNSVTERKEKSKRKLNCGTSKNALTKSNTSKQHLEPNKEKKKQNERQFRLFLYPDFWTFRSPKLVSFNIEKDDRKTLRNSFQSIAMRGPKKISNVTSDHHKRVFHLNNMLKQTNFKRNISKSYQMSRESWYMSQKIWQPINKLENEAP